MGAVTLKTTKLRNEVTKPRNVQYRAMEIFREFKFPILTIAILMKILCRFYRIFTFFSFSTDSLIYIVVTVQVLGSPELIICAL